MEKKERKKDTEKKSNQKLENNKEHIHLLQLLKRIMNLFCAAVLFLHASSSGFLYISSNHLPVKNNLILFANYDSTPQAEKASAEHRAARCAIDSPVRD